MVLLIKCSLFFIVPGFLFAEISLWIIINAVKRAIEHVLMRFIILDFTFFPVFVGLCIAYGLPILSMIQPVINGLAVELRDALDISRKKTELVDI